MDDFKMNAGAASECKQIREGTSPGRCGVPTEQQMGVLVEQGECR